MSNMVEIGGATLYLGDCREIVPTLGRVCAVITDPPYGINENSRKVAGRGKLAAPRDYGEFDWDKEPPSRELIQLLRDKSDFQAFFGGNFFDLPPSSCWLIWDKLNTGDFADCELVWTNWPKAIRIIRWLWNGMIRKDNEARYHPTQKPLGVMKWVISQCPSSALIMDPFMGSGTTGVAATQMGLGFIGIERDPRYFEIACRRIEDALNQPDLFVAPSPPPTQETLL